MRALADIGAGLQQELPRAGARRISADQTHEVAGGGPVTDEQAFIGKHVSGRRAATASVERERTRIEGRRTSRIVAAAPLKCAARSAEDYLSDAIPLDQSRCAADSQSNG
jgi:hypothetical protein